MLSDRHIDDTSTIHRRYLDEAPAAGDAACCLEPIESDAMRLLAAGLPCCARCSHKQTDDCPPSGRWGNHR